MADGSELIDPDELIYRRIPQIWAGDAFPSPLAFTPKKDDSEGLSVYRAKYTQSIAEIAYNTRGANSHVAILHAKDLIDAGIEITPSPLEGKPGHAHLASITYANRKDPAVVNLITLLTTKLCRTEGPFPANPMAPPDTTLPNEI